MDGKNAIHFTLGLDAMMRKLALVQLVFGPSLAFAVVPQCSDQALAAAKKLLAYHAGFVVQDPTSASVYPPRHLATKLSRSKDGTTLELYETGALIDPAGYYTMQLSFLVLKKSCMLVGQEIHESWIDDRFRNVAGKKK